MELAGQKTEKIADKVNDRVKRQRSKATKTEKKYRKYRRREKETKMEPSGRRNMTINESRDIERKRKITDRQNGKNSIYRGRQR
jgi:hypothetical protein